jgi:hypothetical protein
VEVLGELEVVVLDLEVSAAAVVEMLDVVQ